MTLRVHEVELTNETETHRRFIVDSNSIRALRIGLGKMPDDIAGPLSVICTPLCELNEAHLPEEISCPA